MKTRNLFYLICFALIFLCGCGSKKEQNETAATLNIAYQYGMAYAPLQVMKEQKLIEKHYDSDITINWQILNSGAAINEGMIAGTIDIGAMGVAPGIIGVMKGIPYKIFSALSSQPHSIITNDPDIRSLKDIQSENKIALINIGSIQHILLDMAAKAELGDAHALDNNIVAMSHPDGMTALLSGSVDCQLTTSPYVFKEQDAGMTAISSISQVWPDGNSFIIGMASEKLHDEKPELYQAVCAAMQDAVDYITENPEAAAEMLCENEGVTADVMLEWLKDPSCSYSTETKGVMDMASFMSEEGFIDSCPDSFAVMAYDNVKGN